MKFNLVVAGSAGQGMNTISDLLEVILKRNGLYLFSNKDYMSRVRGGHNFINIRFSNTPLYSHYPDIDLIVAMDETSILNHKSNLLDNGYILCDSSIAKDESKYLSFNFKEIAKELKNPKVISGIMLGSIVKILNLNKNVAINVIKEKLSKNLIEINLIAFEKGFELAKALYDFNIPDSPLDKRILINGNEAIALGALAAGLDFYSAYPMTPSTSIMTYVAKKQKQAKVVVEQAEDEIAAINMALGASYAGARSMTASSGGGFSLMVESLGLVGITETPLVVADVQRPSPATGLPTRTEQSDLSFVVSASHGEIPRLILSVRNQEDAFYQTIKALNLADKYQILVILLNDQYLADANASIDEYDFSKVEINRYLSKPNNDEKYLRYKLTESGISPRIIPGQFEGQTVLVDSDEHNEEGHITESSQMRIDMMNKRMKKMNLLQEEVQEPDYFGSKNPKYVLVGWGSTWGSLKEAVEDLNLEGIDVCGLSFGDLYPLPQKTLNDLSNKGCKFINVEQNYTGQLAKLIRQETGLKFDHSILKFDGRQINPKEIKNQFKSEVL